MRIKQQNTRDRRFTPKKRTVPVICFESGMTRDWYLSYPW